MHPRLFLPAGPALDAPPAASRPHDGAHLSTYLLIATISLLAGLILGSLSAPAPGGSRVGWPQPPVNPRSLNP